MTDHKDSTIKVFGGTVPAGAFDDYLCSPGEKYERTSTQAYETRQAALAAATTEADVDAAWARFLEEITEAGAQLMNDLKDAVE